MSETPKQPTTTTKKPRAPRSLSRFLILNQLETRQNPSHDSILCELLGRLGLPDNAVLAVIEAGGETFPGIKAARSRITKDRIAGKKLRIVCIRREGSSEAVQQMELKGL